jgi:hypothetical protein
VKFSRTACASPLLLSILALPSLGWAQTGNQASLDGLGADQSGAVIAGAQVSVRQLETGASFTTATNESGLFRFPVLPVGTYLVQAERADSLLSCSRVLNFVSARVSRYLWVHGVVLGRRVARWVAKREFLPVE